MNRAGGAILLLAAANAVIAASMAGAGLAAVIVVALVGAAWLWLRRAPDRTAAEAGPVGARALVVGRRDGMLLVRLGERDWPARPVPGASLPGYGDAVRVEAVEGAVLIVRPGA